MSAYLIAIFLGASVCFAFAPFDQWYLLFPSLIAFIILINQHKAKPFLLAWCYGLGFFGAGISWVHVSIATYGGMPLIASILIMVVLCAYLAIYFGLAFYLLKRFISFHYWPLVGPLIWLFCEWLRAHMLTGFPWLSIAYSQLDSPMAYLAPVIGEIGMSAMIFGICASAALCIISRSKQYKLLLSYSIVLIVAVVISANQTWVQATGESKQVALVQGNIEQSIKWQPERHLPIIEKYMQLTEDHWDADLIVWPEAAIPSIESSALTNRLLLELDDLATLNNNALITGTVDLNVKTDKAHNYLIALGIDKDQKNTLPYYYEHENRFAKHQLLPIGEFVPFEAFLRQIAPLFDLPFSSFSRGDYVQANLLADDMSLVPAICYEIVFPKQIRANITQQSDMIVTVSNDAWFGESHGPHQHLQIARMRALEFGLPVIRATNNGVTAAIDARGNVIDELPQFIEGVLRVNIDLVKGETPYLRFGNILAYAICMILALFSMAIQWYKNG